MKYLIKVGYYCYELRNRRKKLFIIEQDKPPELGVINKAPFASGPLPNHDCKKHYYSQTCDDDETCNWQKILEIQTGPIFLGIQTLDLEIIALG
jgi:hypothetical protein